MVKSVTGAVALEKLKKLYRRKAGSWALQHLGFHASEGSAASFPLHPPTQHTAMQDQQGAINWVASWRAHPKLAEFVQWEARHWSLLGTQQVPVRLEVPHPAQLAAAIGETAHWTRLNDRFAILQQRTSNTAEQFYASLNRNTDGITALDDVDFHRLVNVLIWFADHPASNLYIRQLPIRGVDTKWIRHHHRLVTQLHMANTGRSDLGLQSAPERWRIRLLDQAMWLQSLSDITAPVDELARLNVTPAKILIVENLTSLLTLPPMAETVAIFGQGTAVSGLTRIPWIHAAEVYYWGDLDTHGFRILQSLRSAGIETSSLLMDAATLQHFQDLWVTETKPFAGELGLLTLSEAEAFDYLRENPGTRLEQERIDWSYVLDTLRAHGLLTDGLD